MDEVPGRLENYDPRVGPPLQDLENNVEGKRRLARTGPPENGEVVPLVRQAHIVVAAESDDQVRPLLGTASEVPGDPARGGSRIRNLRVVLLPWNRENVGEFAPGDVASDALARESIDVVIPDRLAESENASWTDRFEVPPSLTRLGPPRGEPPLKGAFR